MYDRKILEEHYVHRINPKDKGHVILDWENEDAHLGRFEVLVRKLDLSGMHILDVGCGIGDFYRYLQEHGISASYTGIDILPEMIKEAKRRNPEGEFISGDLFSQKIYSPGSFDLVFSSGIFNLKVGDNHALLRDALQVFFTLSRQWVVFNLLDPDHHVQRDIYCYFDPQEVLGMVMEHTSLVEMERDYVPKDYTIFARKELSSDL